MDFVVKINADGQDVVVEMLRKQVELLSLKLETLDEEHTAYMTRMEGARAHEARIADDMAHARAYRDIMMEDTKFREEYVMREVEALERIADALGIVTDRGLLERRR